MIIHMIIKQKIVKIIKDDEMKGKDGGNDD